MKRNFIISLLVLSVMLFTSVNAQLERSTTKVGTTAAQFLKIGAGARAIGMGGTYTGISNDIYAVYWNPAGILVHQESA